MKRVFLFIVTNLAVMLVLSISVRLLGVDRFLTAQGLNLGTLLVFSAVIGFGGSFISLFMSKFLAKWGTGAKVITQPKTPEEAWLLQAVGRLANNANLPMPEVAIYQGQPNAFATGPSKKNALVAVSTGLLQSMDRTQVEAVLAHEMSHVANGDMVTLTLIQGVVNTFVIFLSRIAGYVVDGMLRKNDNSSGPGIGYYLSSFVFEIVFGILASTVVMYFSRRREFRADAGAAQLMGNAKPMIEALTVLGNLKPGALPREMAASGITGGGVMALFASHPPIAARIAALQSKL